MGALVGAYFSIISQTFNTLTAVGSLAALLIVYVNDRKKFDQPSALTALIPGAIIGHYLNTAFTLHFNVALGALSAGAATFAYMYPINPWIASLPKVACFAIVGGVTGYAVS